MRVGLVNIEPNIHNTAYMQTAAWHRGKGDEVDWYAPLYSDSFAVVYCSSLFQGTDKTMVPRHAVLGCGLGLRVTGRQIMEAMR